MAEPFFAVDVGGSSVKSAVVVDGEVQELSREPVAQGADELVAQLVRLYARFAGNTLLPWGLCLPGLVDSHRGLVGYSANLGLRNVGVLELLEAEVPRPRVMENDLVAAAVGEAGGGTLALIQLGAGTAAARRPTEVGAPFVGATRRPAGR